MADEVPPPSWLTEAVRCTKKAKSTGQQCGRPEVPGTAVCRFHGGAAPQVRAKGMERVVEAEARKTFGRLADHARPVENPLDALATTAGEIVAWKDFCAQQIADLQELRSTDDKGTEQINALVALFERSLDRAVAALATISKLNIEDRLAKITEVQARAVVAALEAGFAAAGVTGQSAVDGRTAATRALRVAS